VLKGLMAWRDETTREMDSFVPEEELRPNFLLSRKFSVNSDLS
jgi:hypothetical protein